MALPLLETDGTVDPDGRDRQAEKESIGDANVYKPALPSTMLFSRLRGTATPCQLPMTSPSKVASTFLEYTASAWNAVLMRCVVKEDAEPPRSSSGWSVTDRLR